MGLFSFLRSSKSATQEIAEEPAESPTEQALRLINEGNVAEESGGLAEALSLYERAIQLAPELARAHMNRGNILLANGDASGALNAYEKAIELEPGYAAAHYNAGNALTNMARHDAAATAYEQAISLKPDFTDAHFALACLFEDIGRLEDAITCYQNALKIRPDYPEVQANLGKALVVRGQMDEAISSLARATPHLPEDTGTLLLLGLIEKSRGQLVAARNSLTKVLARLPNSIDVNIHLGDTFLELGQIEDAIARFQRALELDPNNFVAHNNLGNAYFSTGLYHEAVGAYRRALELRPDSAAILSNLGMILKDIGEPEEGIDAIRRALNIDPEFVSARSNLLFISHLSEDSNQMALFTEAKAYGEIVASKATQSTSWKNSPLPSRRLRIGFVSGDLCHHPVGFFIEGVLRALAKNSLANFEIAAYMNFYRVDAVSQRIKALCHQWREIFGFPDEEVARLIHGDEIDILFDLSGHSGGNRLPVFAWKPAPIQVSWLGYFDTTGVKAIDYLIADPVTLPETEEIFFTEKIWRLPDTRLCFTPPDINVAIRALPALDDGHITFGCFNSLNKMGKSVAAHWARILLAVPNSRLLLKARQLYQPLVRESVIAQFRAYGIDQTRLILEGPESRANYLAAYNRVDIALDPFPYTGGTTTAESLWMGVPVLTLSGQHFLARQGVGLLINAGLPEWVATDPDDYVAKAVMYANNIGDLATLRSRLREQVLASPVFDSSRFASHFESALRDMWKIWCNQQITQRNSLPIDAS